MGVRTRSADHLVAGIPEPGQACQGGTAPGDGGLGGGVHRAGPGDGVCRPDQRHVARLRWALMPHSGHSEERGWLWRPAVLRDDAPLSATAAAIALGGQAHLFAPEPTGAVSHVAFGPGGAGVRLPDLALLWVSGAAPGPEGPLVCGARTSNEAPSVCAVDGTTGEADVVELPRADELDAETKLSAWPVPVGSDPPRVVWAVGRDPATVLVGAVTDDGSDIRRITVATRAIWHVQAVAANDDVDVLCQTPEGTKLVHLDGGATTAPATFPSNAVLSPGSVLAPIGGRGVRMWDTASSASRELLLPEPPEGEQAPITALRLLPESSLLVWSTGTSDSEPHDPSGASVRTVSSRGWMASLDKASWDLGQPYALPEASTAVVALAETLVVARDTGSFAVWVGVRSHGTTAPGPSAGAS